jgi:hypothetical protein
MSRKEIAQADGVTVSNVSVMIERIPVYVRNVTPETPLPPGMRLAERAQRYWDRAPRWYVYSRGTTTRDHIMWALAMLDAPDAPICPTCGRALP